MKGPGFFPEEIIFSATTACNLHCPHCYVNRQNIKLSVPQSIDFLKSCKGTSIQKIGFTGGEPFLYFDFLSEITKAAVSMDFLFDQIMTNGDWWQTENQLKDELQKLYDCGYDGKFGLSWDNFHAQKTERIKIFIRNVQEIFGQDSINIQTVKCEDKNHQKNELEINKDYIQSVFPQIQIFELPQVFQCDDDRAWKSKKWFREDFCQGPGNIFFVHPDGNIAPCCGFSNEEKELFIGTINDSYEKLIENAGKSKMIELCFSRGLHTKIKDWKKFCKVNRIKKPGKTSDICTFCQAVCKSKLMN